MTSFKRFESKPVVKIIYITNLVCYAYFHWLFNPECQHIFGKQTGYICTFSVSLIWAPKNNNNVVDKQKQKNLRFTESIS